MIEKYYTIEDIKNILQLNSKSTAYKLVNTPGFPKMKIGRSIRINPKKFEEYMEEHSEEEIILM